MHDIGVAMVGTGFMGPVHVEALKRLSIPVRGILGSSAEKSRRAATALGLPKAYDSFEAVLADTSVDAVHIATPNRLHFPMAKAALLAGKHVLCEKPLAMNSAESAELVDVARRCGKAAGVNYNIRFYPLALQARSMVRGGAVGDVYSISGGYVQDWLLYPTDYNWRVRAEEAGALRAIADIGTHWLDLIHAITGLEAESVCADLRTIHPIRQRPRGEVETFSGKGRAAAATEPIAIQTEDCGSVLIRFKGGARGNLWVSQATAGRKNYLHYELSGSQCALAWNSERPDELWIGHRQKPNEVLLRDPSLLSETARRHTSYPGGHNEGFPDTFKQCFKAFYDFVAAGDFTAAPTFPTFTDGHREIVLCEAILKSHTENRWVSV